MDRVLRSRTALKSRVTDKEQENERKPTRKNKCLADKTNDRALNDRNKDFTDKTDIRTLRSKRGKIGQYDLAKREPLQRNNKKEKSTDKKSCVYKHFDVELKQDMMFEEKVDVYTFEIDENDPQPKKPKRKRKVKCRKKINLSDTTDDEDTVIVKDKKVLRPRVQRRCRLNKSTGQKKTDNSCKQEDPNMSQSEANKKVNFLTPVVLLENYVCQTDTDNKLLTGKNLNSKYSSRRSALDRSHHESINENKSDNKENIPVPDSTSKHNCSQIHEICGSLTEISELNISFDKSGPVNQLGLQKEHCNNNISFSLNQWHTDTDKKLVTGKNSNSKDNSCRSMLDRSRHEPINENKSDNKENIFLPDSTSKHNSGRITEICGDLTKNSKLDWMEPVNQLHSQKEHGNNNIPFSPIQWQKPVLGNFITKRKHKDKETHSTKEFTIDNCFGFDEESEENLSFPLSPEFRPTANLKSTLSIPFAVSSTPNLKPTFSQTKAGSTRLQVKMTKETKNLFLSPPPVSASQTKPIFESTPVQLPVPTKQSATFTSTPLQSVSASLPTVNSATSVKEEATKGTAETNYEPIPVLFMEETEDLRFTKPPRRSYEKPLRIRRVSYTEEERSESEDEIFHKKRFKRSKKVKNNEKVVKKWAANVSAHFDEVDSFSLCIE